MEYSQGLNYHASTVTTGWMLKPVPKAGGRCRLYLADEIHRHQAFLLQYTLTLPCRHNGATTSEPMKDLPVGG